MTMFHVYLSCFLAGGTLMVCQLLLGLLGLGGHDADTGGIAGAVGKTGTVYLSVPGRRAGTGKVTLKLQNRTVEYKAVTPDADLPTGTAVRVVAVVNSDTVEIVPVPQPGSVSHA